MTTNTWQQKYDQWALNQALQQSRQDIPQLDDNKFQQYLDYIAMMTGIEDTGQTWEASSLIAKNYENFAVAWAFATATT